MEENDETKSPEETRPEEDESASTEGATPPGEEPAPGVPASDVPLQGVSATAADVPAEEPEPEFIPDPGLVAVVEAMLFSVNKPLSIEKLAEAAEAGLSEIEHALAELDKSLGENRERGIRLDRAAGGYRLVTRPEFDYPVKRLLGQDGKTKLSMAALETLAIIAYKQPVTAPEIAEIRGVSSASSIRTLLERKLITTAGRKEVVGTPFLYKTTKEFLIHFGISSPADLPRPDELDAMFGIEPAAPPPPEQAELFPDDATPAEEQTAPEPAPAASDGEPRPEVGESETAGDAAPSPLEET